MPPADHPSTEGLNTLPLSSPATPQASFSTDKHCIKRLNDTLEIKMKLNGNRNRKENCLVLYQLF